MVPPPLRPRASTRPRPTMATRWPSRCTLPPGPSPPNTPMSAALIRLPVTARISTTPPRAPPALSSTSAPNAMSRAACSEMPPPVPPATPLPVADSSATRADPASALSRGGEPIRITSAWRLIVPPLPAPVRVAAAPGVPDIALASSRAPASMRTPAGAKGIAGRVMAADAMVDAVVDMAGDAVVDMAGDAVVDAAGNAPDEGRTSAASAATIGACATSVMRPPAAAPEASSTALPPTATWAPRTSIAPPAPPDPVASTRPSRRTVPLSEVMLTLPPCGPLASVRLVLVVVTSPAA